MDNKRLKFILDMVDEITTPTRSAGRSLQDFGKKAASAKKEMDSLNKQAADIKALEGLRGELKSGAAKALELRDKVATLTKAIAATDKPTKAMRAELRAATKDADNHDRAMARQAEQAHKVTARLKDAGISTRNLSRSYAENQSRLSAANNELRRHQSELDRATKRQEALTSAKERYARAEGAAQGMMGAGSKAALTGAAMVVAPIAFADQYRQFDKGISAAAATGQLSESQKNALRAEVDKLATASVFSHVEAAGAAGFLAQAGLDDEAIKKALGPVMSLAAATGSDLQQTADISSNIMSGFKMGADQMERVSDVLTKAANAFNVDLPMLGESMKYAAPVAQTLNIALEETAAMVGLLGNVGIQGSQSGNALKSMYGSLAAPTGNKAKVLAELGVSSRDENGNVKSIPGLMKELQIATRGMGNGQVVELFKTLFGEEFYGPAMEIVSQGGEVLDKAIRDMENAKGAAADAERKRLDNLDGDIVKAGNQISAMQIKFGASMDKFYRGMARVVTAGLERVNEWMAANPRLVAVLGVLVTALGALLAISGVVVVGLGALWLMLAKVRLALFLVTWATKAWLPALMATLRAVILVAARLGLIAARFVAVKAASLAFGAAAGVVRVAMLALNVVMRANPIGLLITAITALVAAGVWLYKNWDDLPGAFSRLWETITGFLGWDPLEVVKGAWDGLSGYFSGLFGGIWENFKGTIGKIGDWFAEKGSWVLNGFGMLDGDVKEAVSSAPVSGSGLAGSVPIASGGQVKAAVPVVSQQVSSPVTIHIHPTEGMSARDVAREIKVALSENNRKAATATRAAMVDQ